MPETDNLPALQDHVRRFCTYYGWQNSAERNFLLLTEEIGELAKAVRRMEKIDIEVGKELDEATVRTNLEEEFADVLSYLLDLANHFNVDVAEAYKNKMIKNFSRSWK